MSLENVAEKYMSRLFANRLYSGCRIAEPIIYRKVTQSNFDPATGTFSSSVNEYTTTAIRVQDRKGDIRDANGAIFVSDIKIIIQPIPGLELKNYTDDQIFYSGKVYRVASVEKKILGASDLCYLIRASLLM